MGILSLQETPNSVGGGRIMYDNVDDDNVDDDDDDDDEDNDDNHNNGIGKVKLASCYVPGLILISAALRD